LSVAHEVAGALLAQLAAFLAVLLIATAAHKALTWRRTRTVVQNFAGVPRPAASFAAVAACAIEGVAGLLLVLPDHRRAGAALASAILGLYLALIVRAVAQRRGAVDCGCSFGAAGNSCDRSGGLVLGACCCWAGRSRCICCCPRGRGPLRARGMARSLRSGNGLVMLPLRLGCGSRPSSSRVAPTRRNRCCVRHWASPRAIRSWASRSMRLAATSRNCPGWSRRRSSGGCQTPSWCSLSNDGRSRSGRTRASSC